MATIAPSPAGGPVTYVGGATGGDVYLNTGREMLHVKNGNTGTGNVVVSIARHAACSQGTIHTADTHTIDDGEDELIPAVDPVIYNNPTGQVEVSYSAVTGVTVAVIA
jgi:hypothetical protein